MPFFFFFLDVPQLKIDKSKKLCYYIYVIERETERPLCSRLPEETAEKKMNLLVAQGEEQPQMREGLWVRIPSSIVKSGLVSRGLPIEHYVVG